MGSYKSRQHYLVNIGRQVVMEKQSSVIKEEGNVVEQVASQKDFACIDKLFPCFCRSKKKKMIKLAQNKNNCSLSFTFRNVVALTSPAKQIKDQQRRVCCHPGGATIPNYQVTQKMNLSLLNEENFLKSKQKNNFNFTLEALEM